MRKEELKFSVSETIILEGYSERRKNIRKKEQKISLSLEKIENFRIIPHFLSRESLYYIGGRLYSG
jgi:hypothetical protein